MEGLHEVFWHVPHTLFVYFVCHLCLSDFNVLCVVSTVARRLLKTHFLPVWKLVGLGLKTVKCIHWHNKLLIVPLVCVNDIHGHLLQL